MAQSVNQIVAKPDWPTLGQHHSISLYSNTCNLVASSNYVVMARRHVNRFAFRTRGLDKRYGSQLGVGHHTAALG